MVKKKPTIDELEATLSGRTPRDGHAFVEDLYKNAEWYGQGPSSVNTDAPPSREVALDMAKDGKLRPWHEGYRPGADVLTLSQVRMVHFRLDKIEEMLKHLCRRDA